MTTPLFQAGDRYVRLVIVSEAERYISPGGQSRRMVNCMCDCGQAVTVRTSSLRSGLTLSCGCLQAERAAQSGRDSATHGMTDSDTYHVWQSMKQRCENEKHECYDHYGGRGISVCERWQSFENFLVDMGECPDGLTLDRRDNNGNYEPGNCRWATWFQQNSNRRGLLLLTMDGETLCAAEWARRTGINQDTIRWRIRRGWTVAEALTTVTRQLVTLRDDLAVPNSTRLT